MKNGRTVHSLIKCLSQYEGNRFVLISTPQLQIPQYIRDVLHANNCPYACLDSLEAAIPELDVLYMTRIQQERFSSPAEYEKQKVCMCSTGRSCVAQRKICASFTLCRVWMRSLWMWMTTRAQNISSRENTACMPHGADLRNAPEELR